MKIKHVITVLLIFAMLSLCGCYKEVRTCGRIPERVKPDSVPEEETFEAAEEYPDLPEDYPVRYRDFEFEENTELGGVSVTRYTGSNTIIRIPDTVWGKSVVSVDCFFSDDVTQIEFPDTLVYIKWFPEEIRYFNIPSSLQYIGEKAPDFTYKYSAKIHAIKLNKLVMVKTSDGVKDFRNKNACVTEYGGVIDLDEGKFNVTDQPVREFDLLLDCVGVTEIEVPDGVKELERGAFSGCTDVTSVTIPDSVTSIYSRAFSDCPALSEIKADEDSEWFSSVDGVLYGKDKGVLYRCPEGTRILYRYPPGKTDTSFTIPEDVWTVNDSAFQGCENLESVTITAVREMGYDAFEGCKSLKRVETLRWVNLYHVFPGCPIDMEIIYAY